MMTDSGFFVHTKFIRPCWIFEPCDLTNVRRVLYSSENCIQTRDLTFENPISTHTSHLVSLHNLFSSYLRDLQTR